MKDKEKAKEDLTSFSLTIAVIVFAFLGYLTFVAFLSTKPESETAVGWLLKFMDKYGAFLASIPVLFAVLVAKQQLDANRRQHVATVRRGFYKELEAIRLAQEAMHAVLSMSATEIIKNCQSRQLMPSLITGDQATQVAGELPSRLADHILWCVSEVNLSTERYGIGSYTLTQFEDRIRFIQVSAQIALNELDMLYEQIEQYWS